MSNSLFKLALLNVTRNRRRSAVTLVAIVIGISISILLKGIVVGFVNLMVQNAVQTKVGAIQIHKRGYLDNVSGNPLKFHFPYDPALLKKIAAVPGVTAVTGRIIFTGLISNGVRQTMFLGAALDLEHEKTVCPRSSTLIEQGGFPLEPGDQSSITLGGALAESLKIIPTALLSAPASAPQASDMITLSSASPDGRQNSMDVHVKGLMRSSLPFEEKRMLNIPLTTAQALLGLEGEVTELVIAVKDLNQVLSLVAQLQTAVGPEFEVHDWQQVQPFIRDIIFRQTVILTIVSFVMLILALFIITNTMLMSVFERVREIGTMLAFGMKRAQILTLFIYEAVALAIWGVMAGSALGILIVLGLAQIKIPLPSNIAAQSDWLVPEVSPEHLLLTSLITVLGISLAALYPAWKASRLAPVEALRSL